MLYTDFRKEISQKELPTVVEFWAPWCGPCKMMASSLEKVSRDFDGKVEIWKINADENPDILRSLGVMSIPTMLGFSGGEELFRVTSLEEMEKDAILKMLDLVQGNKSEAARRLGITRRTLHQKLRKYGLM